MHLLRSQPWRSPPKHCTVVRALYLAYLLLSPLLMDFPFQPCPATGLLPLVVGVGLSALGWDSTRPWSPSKHLRRNFIEERVHPVHLDPTIALHRLVFLLDFFLKSSALAGLSECWLLFYDLASLKAFERKKMLSGSPNRLGKLVSFGFASSLERTMHGHWSPLWSVAKLKRQCCNPRRQALPIEFGRVIQGSSRQVPGLRQRTSIVLGPWFATVTTELLQCPQSSALLYCAILAGFDPSNVFSTTVLCIRQSPWDGRPAFNLKTSRLRVKCFWEGH